MRLLIDMQGAQGTSRLRGIGRYSRDLALALAEAGWFAPGAILCAETAREEPPPVLAGFEAVTDPRIHGAAALHILRFGNLSP